MKYSLSFLPEVESDLINAYLWYEEKSKGLGEEFLRVFYANVSEIAYSPFIYVRIYKIFRRLLLKRFPFAVYFTVIKNKVIVYGLFHCARNPNTIEETIQKR